QRLVVQVLATGGGELAREPRGGGLPLRQADSVLEPVRVEVPRRSLTQVPGEQSLPHLREQVPCVQEAEQQVAVHPRGGVALRLDRDLHRGRRAIVALG